MNSILKKLTLNKKLILLYALNLSDILFSILLINSKCCLEANPLMLSLFSEPMAAFLFKAIVPGLLLILVYAIFEYNPDKQFTFSVGLINFAIISYVAVNILHVVIIITHLDLFLKVFIIPFL